MKQIKIKSSAGDSVIFIDEKIKNVRKYISAEKTIIITDSVVKKYYENIFPSADIIEIKSGIFSKNEKKIIEYFLKPPL
jgi:hypothetical protein